MASPTARRWDIDWLRVIATLLLFVFHVGMVFSPAPFYHIRNDELSFGWMIVSGFISLWHMPLFFLLAGWSLCTSLRNRGGAGVARERLLRLLIPLVAGCVLFMPAIKYLELSSGLDLNHEGLRVSPALQAGFRTVVPEGLPTAEPFDESFADFLPTFFTLDRFTWAHLWFVAYLLAFTLIYLPVFTALLRSGHRLRRVPTLLLYSPILPLALVQVVLRPHWPGIQNLYDDWANVAYYTTYLFAGFLLARDPSLEAAAQAEWQRALGLGFGACAVLLGGVLKLYDAPPVMLAGSAFAGWCFVLASLGVAHRFLDFGSATLRYLSEAAFPIYLLHQAAIVIPGYFLLRLPLGVAAKLVLLLVVSVTVTFGVYQLLVRPIPIARFLFGMRPKACPVRRRLVRSAAASIVILATAGGARAETAPEGLWYAEGGAAQVRIAPCGDALCGAVVWLRSPFDENGCPLSDAMNPDPALRTRSVVGLQVLRDLRPAAGSPRTWTDGRIYDPGSGRTYRCHITIDGPNRIRLRGYIGISLLGRTTTWLRVGTEAGTCAQHTSGTH